MIRFIIVGASGSGKTTIAKMLQKGLGLKRCVTHTTRPRRHGEKKSAYHFVTEEEFKKIPMLESEKFGNEYYGSTKEEVEKADFIVLEPKGVAFYIEKMPWLKVIKLERKSNVSAERKNRDDTDLFDSVNYDYLIKKKSREAVRKEIISTAEKIMRG